MTEKNQLQEYCQKNKLTLPLYKSWSIGESHKLQWSSTVTIKLNNKDITLESTVPSNSKTGAERQAAVLMMQYIKSIKNNSSLISRNDETISERDDELLEYLSSPDVDHKDMDFDPYVLIDSDDENSDKSKADYITRMKTKPNIDPSLISIIYLIDLENKPFFRCKINKNNCLYIGFLNSIHHSVKKYNSWYKCKTDSIDKEIVESKNYRLLYLIDGGTADLVDHFMTAFVYPVTDFIQTYNICPIINIISGDHAGWCTRACLEKILKWRKITNIEINNAAFI